MMTTQEITQLSTESQIKSGHDTLCGSLDNNSLGKKDNGRQDAAPTLENEKNFSVVNNLTEHLEAVLFLSGEGVETKDLAAKFNVREKEVVEAFKTLQAKYSGDCGIHLIKYRNSWQFSTNPKYAERVAEILNPIRTKNLTKTALETLAIIAYKQPITRTEVDDIRGVDSAYGVQILTQNNLIEVVGRKDTIGKPLLYATTDEFLKRFELESIDNLPAYEDLLEKIKVIHTQGVELYAAENR